MSSVITFTREAVLTESAINVEARTAKVAFSSEKPVLRRDRSSGKLYWEILDHAETRSVNLSRMKSAPLLKDHDLHQQIGTVLNFKINTIERLGRAKVMFFDDEPSERLFRHVVDGHRPGVSVGYIVGDFKSRGHDKDGVEIRVYQWEPYEISSVSVPQDPDTGIGRELQLPEPATEPKQQQDQPIMDPANPPKEATPEAPAQSQATVEPPAQTATRSLDAPQVYVPSAEEKAAFQRQETKRQCIIREDGKKFGREQEAEEACKNGTDPAVFLRECTTNWGSDSSGESQAPDPNLIGKDSDISMREINQFDLAAAIRQIRTGGKLKDRELDISTQAARDLGIESVRDNHIYLPADAVHGAKADDQRREFQQRALESGVDTAGGFLVQDSPGQFIEKLDAATPSTRLPILRLTGLVGDLPLNRLGSRSSTSWVGEGATASDSELTLEQVWLRPKRMVTRTILNDQLLVQTSGTARALADMDIAASEGLELDRVFLDGSGAGPEPLGMVNQTGIGTKTFGAAMTWAMWIDMWAKIATPNAAVGGEAYVTSTATIALGLAKAKDSGSGQFCVEPGNDGVFRVMGRPCYETNQTLTITNQVIYAAWQNTIMATWGTQKLVVDEITGAAEGQFKITKSSFHDVGARHVESIAASTDSGAQ